MPLVEITSGKTGKKFTLEFQNAPTQQDVDEALSQIETTPAPQGIPSSQVPRGGFPFPVNPNLARLEAGQRVLARELESRGSAPGLTLGRGGEIEQTRAPLSEARALTEGIGRGASLNLSDAIGTLLTGQNLKDENQPRIQSPQAFSLGETIGNLLPTSLIGKSVIGTKSAVDPILSRIIQGIKLAAPSGAVAAAANVVGEKGTAATPAEIAVEGGKGALLAGAVGGAIPAVGAVAGKVIPFILTPKQSLAALKVEKNAEAIKNTLADIGKFAKANENQQQRLLNGEYAPVLADVAPHFEKGSGAGGFIDAAQKALKERAETFAPIVENANPNLFGGSNLAPKVEARLAQLIPEPETRARALEQVRPFIENATPENLLGFSRQLNDDLIRYYKSAAPETSADVIFAKKAVRDTFGDLIRNTLADAGVDPKVYSQYGMLHELQDLIGDNFRKQEVEHAATVGKGVVERFKEGLNAPITSPRGVMVASAKALAPLTGGEPARLDRQVNQLLDRIVPSKVMTASERQALIDSAKEVRANYDKVAELSRSMKEAQDAARNEALALAATPKEVQTVMNDLMNESVSLAEAGAVQKNLEGTLSTAVRDEVKRIRSNPSGDLLSDYYHILNTSNDPTAIARIETELQRRLSFKKYSKDFPEIREALELGGKGTPQTGPSKRELGVSEAIKEALSR